MYHLGKVAYAKVYREFESPSLRFMKNNEHIPIKWVLIILISLFILLLFFIGYALKEKTYLSLGHIALILLGFILISFLLIKVFYKRSLVKSIDIIEKDNALMNDYINIRQGQFGNEQTVLGKWYFATIIIALIFPVFAKIIINNYNFSRPDYILLILGYIIILIFVIGIFVTTRKK